MAYRVVSAVSYLQLCESIWNYFIPLCAWVQQTPNAALVRLQLQTVNGSVDSLH